MRIEPRCSVPFKQQQCVAGHIPPKLICNVEVINNTPNSVADTDLCRETIFSMDGRRTEPASGGPAYHTDPFSGADQARKFKYKFGQHRGRDHPIHPFSAHPTSRRHKFIKASVRPKGAAGCFDCRQSVTVRRIRLTGSGDCPQALVTGANVLHDRSVTEAGPSETLPGVRH